MNLKKVNNWLWQHLWRHWPNPCVLCQQHSLQRYALCEDCAQQLPRLLHCCSLCALPLPESQHDLLCGQCLHQPRYFSEIKAPLRYQDQAKQLIQAFKYQKQLLHGPILSQLLMQHIEQHPPTHTIDAILPMPLHRWRLFGRGFNQAYEIAKPLAKRFQIPLHYHWVKRVKQTSRQHSLSADARRENLRGAFKVMQSVTDLHIVIIDDVVTTTASVEAMAKALREAGAATVEVWALARTALKD